MDGIVGGGGGGGGERAGCAVGMHIAPPIAPYEGGGGGGRGGGCVWRGQAYVPRIFEESLKRPCHAGRLRDGYRGYSIAHHGSVDAHSIFE